MRACLLLLAVVFITVGNTRAADKPSDSLVGTTDKEGRLIFHVYKGGTMEKFPQALTTDYGVGMYRRTNGEPLFVLGNRVAKSVKEFSNYDDFLRALAKLPKGSTVSIYQRCTVHAFYDFYPVEVELYKKFEKESRKMGLKIAEDPVITCTCGEKG